MRSIPAAGLQANCEALLDSVDEQGIVITKHGRPVARLVRFVPLMTDLIGCMRGKIRIRGNLMATGAWLSPGRRIRR